jgi:hypothetical protein
MRTILELDPGDGDTAVALLVQMSKVVRNKLKSVEMDSPNNKRLLAQLRKQTLLFSRWLDEWETEHTT